MSNSNDKKGSLSNILNADLNEVIYEMAERKEITKKLDMFIRDSEYLQSYIVFIPENNMEDFTTKYEYAKVDYIVPDSFQELCKKYNHVIGHVVALKLSEDSLVNEFKREFGATVRKYDNNPEEAHQKMQQKTQIVNQNQTDKELLEGACIECFKETLVLTIHLKIYLVVIDSCLRFGGMSHFTVILNFFENNKKQRVIKKLIQVYAEKDKIDFYGTKEQLNDAEDFFPFVWTELYLKF